MEYGKTEYGTQYGHVIENRRYKTRNSSSTPLSNDTNKIVQLLKDRKTLENAQLDLTINTSPGTANQVTTPVLSDLDESIKKFKLITINENSDDNNDVVVDDDGNANFGVHHFVL
jgi:DNA/RNA-binding domain of Phe-tRNA-synthetase-like protein